MQISVKSLSTQTKKETATLQIVHLFQILSLAHSSQTLAAFLRYIAIPIACIKKTVDLGLPDSSEILLPTS